MEDHYHTIKDGQLLIFNQPVAKSYLLKDHRHLRQTKG